MTRPARRILVIEDDADTREAMTAALEAAGYRVTASAELFGNVKKLAPDLVILDLFLHGAPHGW